MASRKNAKKKTNKKPGRAGKVVLWCLAGLLLALLATLGLGALHASTVHVRRAEVRLADLPPEFDGVKLLYASDIDLCGLNTPNRSAALFRQLEALRPDILLLGGDYTSSSLLEILNGAGAGETLPARQAAAREAFFAALADFPAPMGKYAACAPDDGDPAALASAMSAAGIHPLFDASAGIPGPTGGSRIYIAGLSGDAGPIALAATAARRGDCVIALTPRPGAIPQIMINEAAGGGPWCDMILTGGTHGGQLRLFGASALSLTGVERNYLKGWRVENCIPILTTSGVGCEGLNVRLGSQAEVWLITLRRADGVVLPDLTGAGG